MIFTTPISNYDEYCSGMSKSMEDKLFFLDKVGPTVDTVLDYGCADGAMLSEVRKHKRNWTLFGYDTDEQMLEKASQTALCFDDYEACLNLINPSHTVLTLSSIIHEIYSYADPDLFWQQVFSGGFQYVSIRDMCIDADTFGKYSPLNDAARVAHLSNLVRYRQFVDRWGGIAYNKNYLHYLLKYRYVTNWDRELQENYLPITVEELKRLIPDDYEIVYEQEYVLPFLQQKVQEDFGVTVRDNTHIKMLLRKRGNERSESNTNR